MHKNILILVALSLFSGCVTYNEKTINLQNDTVAWEKLSKEFSGELSFQKALETGLILNLDLNKMRIKYAQSEEVEKESGWWNDPSFSVGIARQYNPGWQTNLSGGVAFTLPITGLPGLEKEIASYYREADYWELAQLEIDYKENLENMYNAYLLTKLKCEITENRFKELKDEFVKMERLFDVGEVSFAKYQIVNSRLSEVALNVKSLIALEYTQKLDLIKMIGLHPSIIDSVEFSSLKKISIPENISSPKELNLLLLPKMRSLLASYAATESELKTEIRKQYPELILSPGFEQEGDDDITKNFSLGISFDLPLWNRNRRAIAISKGNREVKYLETIQKWRELVFETKNLLKRQGLIRENCLTEETRLEQRKRSFKRLEKLIVIGESDLADVSEARQDAYAAELTYLDYLFELQNIQSRLKALNTVFITQK